MLDVTVGGSITRVAFNAVSGTLVKSADKSKFVRFHQSSYLAEYFFDIDKPTNKGRYSNDSKEIVVLQVMLCGNEQFLVEYLEVEKS